MASCLVDGIILLFTTNWGLDVPPQVSHFRSIDPGAMGSHASTGTVCVCALIHQTLILIFRTLIQLIFSCVLIIADNRQNNYFCMSVKLEVIWYNNITIGTFI